MADETTFWDFLSLWLRPENFWIILGSLLVYYLRVTKPILEKTNAILDRYALSKEEYEKRERDKQRHYETMNLTYKAVLELTDKLDEKELL